jgi:beta-glucosidase
MYMKIIVLLPLLLVCLKVKLFSQEQYQFKPFIPPVSFNDADKRAEIILAKLSTNEKIHLIGGYNMFFIKGYPQYGMPQLYLSDATQGVHIRKDLSDQIQKSTAFPCPIALTATWNPELAWKYAEAIGEECRAGDIAVLLGPGMNIYRISQNGRNFEYFGEDPFLAARMVENYVAGLQSTGTIATLKHFLCNNDEFHRRRTNVIVDERTLHEIYLPSFKAGVDAGAMAVMTSYNMVNGEYSAQSQYVIGKLLRKDLGFRGLVMSDWWSTWDPVKTMKSGLDLEMPGKRADDNPVFKTLGDIFVIDASPRLLKEGKVSEEDINRMAKNIIRTCISMGLYDRHVKDEKYLENYPEHEKLALQTAREAIVLLRNEKNILPINPKSKKKILLTGDYAEKIARGLGSAEVLGYNNVSLVDALKTEFPGSVLYEEQPSDAVIKNADIVLLSVGTEDHEGWDKSFSLPAEKEEQIKHIAKLNKKTIVLVNTGSGIKMTNWNTKVAAIVYCWYAGQNGYTALAEILSGKTNPSGKLPITIEKKFEDSPGYPYMPEGAKSYVGWDGDWDMAYPVNNLKYKEGVFIGYRWYERKKIQPLYPFGFGLSYTKFGFGDLKLSSMKVEKGENLTVEFTVKNTGHVAGAEVAQLYVHDIKASVERPVKELKGFRKVYLNPGESKKVQIILAPKDFAFWDVNHKDWNAEPGEFTIMVGSSSNDIKKTAKVILK